MNSRGTVLIGLRMLFVGAAGLLSGEVAMAHDGHATGIAVGSPETLLAIYCLAIAAAAMLGGWLPELFRMTHIRMQMSLSLIGGLILGIAVLHLWPHAVYELGENGAERAGSWTMVGMVATFLMLRLFHFHDHGQPHPAQSDDDHAIDAHTHCDHGHRHTTQAAHNAQYGSKRTSHAWLGTALGLTIHTFSDGAALGAALAAGQGSGNLPAFGVFLAVCLHKPLDTMTVAMLMKAHGWSITSRTIVVMLLSAACPVGAAIMWGFASPGDPNAVPYIGIALAIAAGIFLCIALGDLLPEMEFHSHHGWLLTTLLLLGIAIAWGLTFIEPHHHGNAFID